MSRGSANVENHRKIVPGIELAAKHEDALEHTGCYPNLNPRRIVSDVSLFRYAKIGWSYIYAHSTIPVKGRAENAFLSVTPPNDFHAYPFDKSV